MGNKSSVNEDNPERLQLTNSELESCGVKDLNGLTVTETAYKYSLPSAILNRPASAQGTFLRIIAVNDVYKLNNYPKVATAVLATRAATKALDCVCIST